MIAAYFDRAGLVKVEIIATEGERAEFHHLFVSLRPKLDELNEFIVKQAKTEEAVAAGAMKHE